MRLFLFAFVLLFTGHAFGQSSLPPCPAKGVKYNCFGKFSILNGGEYVGEWKYDKYDGQGNLTLPNGERYVGEFLDGEYHGQGMYTRPDGEKYIGEFRRGKFNGQGTYTHPNGGKYVGEFRGGERHGQGVRYAANGNVLESGRWESDRLVQASALDLARFPFDSLPQSTPHLGSTDATFGQSGLPPCPTDITARRHQCYGRLTFPDGGKYVGEFQYGKPSGRGTLTWVNAKYVGEFQDGKRTGQGTFTSKGGDKYVGEFRDDKRTGHGTYTWANGTKYVGEFRDGKFNGLGVHYSANGVVQQSGWWVNGNHVQSFALEGVKFAFDDTRVASDPTQRQEAERPNALAIEEARERERQSEQARLAAAEAERLRQDEQRIASALEQERKKRQEVEQRLAASEARERERIQAQAQPAPLTQRPQVAPRPERRVALVIGNSNYKVGRLENPVNDATDMAAALRGLGFEVTLLQDATLPQMRASTRAFEEAVAAADVALIFYAGHGIEVRGRNYMIPVNADIQREYELDDQAYSAGQWLDMLEGAKGRNPQRVNIVILDACRDNSLTRSWRSSAKGLGRMDAPSGTILVYSTAPGKVAEDGAAGQRNSPFTKHLLQSLQTPNVPVELVLRETRRRVVAETKGEQVPWEHSSLIGEFVFRVQRD